jgi:hypothetical protein
MPTLNQSKKAGSQKPENCGAAKPSIARSNWQPDDRKQHQQQPELPLHRRRAGAGLRRLAVSR